MPTNDTPPSTASPALVAADKGKHAGMGFPSMIKLLTQLEEQNRRLNEDPKFAAAPATPITGDGVDLDTAAPAASAPGERSRSGSSSDSSTSSTTAQTQSQPPTAATGQQLQQQQQQQQQPSHKEPKESVLSGFLHTSRRLFSSASSTPQSSSIGTPANVAFMSSPTITTTSSSASSLSSATQHGTPPPRSTYHGPSLLGLITGSATRGEHGTASSSHDALLSPSASGNDTRDGMTSSNNNSSRELIDTDEGESGDGSIEGYMPLKADDSAEGQAAASTQAGEQTPAEDPEWSFWAEVAHAPPALYKKKQREISANIKQGVPEHLRGIVWPRFCGGRDLELEQRYADLLNETSSYEKDIVKDVDRTFPGHEFFSRDNRSGQQALFNLMKAYAVYDEEVGYCQGLAFVGGLLLLNMPEEEAFGVLVRLLKEHHMRSFYLPTMEGLHVAMYQLDALIAEMLPALHHYFAVFNISTIMYASEWFMTILVTSVPHQVALRLFDVFLVEGQEMIFRVGLAMLTRNQAELLTLNYDGLLQHLKQQYLYHSHYKDVNDLLNDASKIKIGAKKLQKLEKEAIAQCERDARERSEIEQLRQEKKQLETRVRLLESFVSQQHSETKRITESFVSVKIENQALMEQHEHMEQVGREMQRQIDRLIEGTEMEWMRNHIAELKGERDELEKNLVTTKLNFAEAKTRLEEFIQGSPHLGAVSTLSAIGAMMGSPGVRK